MQQLKTTQVQSFNDRPVDITLELHDCGTYQVVHACNNMILEATNPVNEKAAYAAFAAATNKAYKLNVYFRNGDYEYETMTEYFNRL